MKQIESIFPIKFEFTKDSSETILSMSELLVWLEYEANYWNWAFKYIRAYSISEHIDPYEFLREARIKLIKYSDDLENNIHIILSIIEELYGHFKTKPFLLSKSNKAVFINSHRNEDEELAAYIVAHFMAIPLTTISTKNVEAIIISSLFSKGLTKSKIDENIKENTRIKNECKLLTEKIINCQKFCDSINSKANDALNRVHNVTLTISNQTESLLKNNSILVNKHLSVEKEKIDKALNETLNINEEKLKSGLEKNQEEIRNFIESFKEEITLKAPVVYWIENSKSHKKEAGKYFKILILSAPIMVAGLIFLIWHTFYSKNFVDWGRLGILLTLSTFIIWFIRIMTRLYLSHIHLESNSNERVVMAKTYLSLIKEGAAGNDAEKEIIIKSLFRPAATGIITNDGAPNTVIDLLSKISHFK